jgi:hypothetical protein
MDGLQKRLKFRFQVNYHSAAELLLYPFGWQVETPSADDPIDLRRAVGHRRQARDRRAARNRRARRLRP